MLLGSSAHRAEDHGREEHVARVREAGSEQQRAHARAEDPLLREWTDEQVAHDEQPGSRVAQIGGQLAARNEAAQR